MWRGGTAGPDRRVGATTVNAEGRDVGTEQRGGAPTVGVLGMDGRSRAEERDADGQRWMAGPERRGEGTRAVVETSKGSSEVRGQRPSREERGRSDKGRENDSAQKLEKFFLRFTQCNANAQAREVAALELFNR